MRTISPASPSRHRSYSQNVNIDSLDVPIRKGLPGSVTWRINPFEILPMGTRISFPGWDPHGFGTLVFSFSRPLLVERDRQRYPPVHARRIVVPIILADTRQFVAHACGSSESRLAITQPAEPPPTMMWS